VRKEKAAAAAQHVASIELVFNKDEVEKLKGQNLKDHLKAFKAAGAPNLQDMPLNTRVGDICEGIKQAIDLYSAGEWKPGGDESESGEEFEDLDDDESDGWEDDDD